jgi:hypothetical protein
LIDVEVISDAGRPYEKIKANPLQLASPRDPDLTPSQEKLLVCERGWDGWGAEADGPRGGMGGCQGQAGGSRNGMDGSRPGVGGSHVDLNSPQAQADSSQVSADGLRAHADRA